MYEALGPADGKPLLLATGISGQLIDWPDGLCQLLIEHGFRVARFDTATPAGPPIWPTPGGPAS